MQPDAAKYLHDVGQACELLQQLLQRWVFFGGLQERFADENEFPFDSGTQKSIGLIIGKRLPACESVTALRQIIGFRNILVHGYATVQNQTVWGVVENDVALLRKQVEDLLAKAGPP